MPISSASLELLKSSLDDPTPLPTTSHLITLAELKMGEKAEVVKIDESFLGQENSLPEGELERRLLEMGFVEGTVLTLQHEGGFGRDPIAVLIRVCYTIALRRNEAKAILVRKIS